MKIANKIQNILEIVMVLILFVLPIFLLGFGLDVQYLLCILPFCIIYLTMPYESDAFDMLEDIVEPENSESDLIDMLDYETESEVSDNDLYDSDSYDSEFDYSFNSYVSDTDSDSDSYDSVIHLYIEENEMSETSDYEK